MKKINSIISIILTLMLVLGGSVLSVSAKEEVAYVNLNNDGTTDKIYIVNIFDLDAESAVSDYGAYDTVVNLTDTGAITLTDDAVSANTKAGRFYYQGNLKSTDLPWIINLKYYLDGSEIKAEELSGKSGELKLQITTKSNPAIDKTFYENYMLQISVTLSTVKCSNITAEGATFANAGKDKLITFTAMPGTDGDFIIKSNVKDFSMSGIQLNGIPFTMSVDLPDISGLTSGLTDLAAGVDKLNTGSSTLVTGLEKLKKGSADYLQGINKISSQSVQITQSSAKILEALESLSQALTGSPLKDSFDALVSSYSTFNGGITAYTAGVDALAKNYASLDGGLGQSISGTSELAGGISSLNAQTKDIDKKISGSVDEIMSGYNKSDFKPVSFVSSKNEDVTSVQFVIKTTGVKELTAEKAVDETPKELNIWQRFIKLFGIS